MSCRRVRMDRMRILLDHLVRRRIDQPPAIVENRNHDGVTARRTRATLPRHAVNRLQPRRTVGAQKTISPAGNHDWPERRGDNRRRRRRSLRSRFLKYDVRRILRNWSCWFGHRSAIRSNPLGPGGMSCYKRGMAATEAKIWTIGDLLNWTTEFFTKKNIDEPRLSAELLLSHTLGCSRMALYTQYETMFPPNRNSPPTAPPSNSGPKTCQLRISSAKLPGSSPWNSAVNRDVLIPRPDPETLVEQVIQRARQTPGWEAPSILDLCTGSGCIAVALAKNLKAALATGRRRLQSDKASWSSPARMPEGEECRGRSYHLRSR